VAHYEIAGEHFAATKGYEHYATGAAAMREHGTDAASDGFADLQIAGTPDEVVAELRQEVDLGVELFICQFTDFGRPETIRLFADEVLPALG
jgi:alkanesulfonate monooxygenase SsuD/methylene tetrahydromethanopterin reductase-like flavin-dependent oxidoreductase (luciferase family)